MASRRLPRHLHASIGSEAGEELVTILDEIRADGACMQARLDRLENKLNAGFERMNERFTTVEVKIAESKADLMKWSFVFWCGAVASIAALAGVLR